MIQPLFIQRENNKYSAAEEHHKFSGFAFEFHIVIDYVDQISAWDFFGL